MKTLLGVALAAAALAPLTGAPATAQTKPTAVAQAPANSKPSMVDQRFLKEAAAGSLAEVHLGNWRSARRAARRSSSSPST